MLLSSYSFHMDNVATTLLKSSDKILKTDVTKLSHKSVENTKAFLECVLFDNDEEKIEYRRKIRKIWFEFRNADTNMALWNNLETAYESAFLAKRLYAFGAKEDFYGRFATFKRLVDDLERILLMAKPDAYSVVSLLEKDLEVNADLNHTVGTVHSIIEELSGVAYYH